MKAECWFRDLARAGPCEGALVRCHLIDQQEMRKRFPKGAVKIDGRWFSVQRLRRPDPEMSELAHLIDDEPVRRTLEELQADERSFVPGCGGLVGLSGHHGRFDFAAHDRSRLIVPRSMLPAETIEYAAELELTPWLERTYH